MRFIAATRRGRYEVRGTRNAAKVARDRYGLNRPGVSPAFEADSPQTDESLFPFEASTDGLLDKNVTSTKQEEPALLCQQDVGVDDEEKEATTTTKPADVRKFVSPKY